MILKVSNVLTVALINGTRERNKCETVVLHLVIVSLIVTGKIRWAHARTASNLLE